MPRKSRHRVGMPREFQASECRAGCGCILARIICTFMGPCVAIARRPCIDSDRHRSPAGLLTEPTEKVSQPMFRCKVCGWIHEGETPPDSCPSCGSPADRFRPMTGQEVGLAAGDLSAY